MPASELWHATIPAEDGFYWVYDTSYVQVLLCHIYKGQALFTGDSTPYQRAGRQFLFYACRLTPPPVPPLAHDDSFP